VIYEVKRDDRKARNRVKNMIVNVSYAMPVGTYFRVKGAEVGRET